jgi:hypothetical protein
VTADQLEGIKMGKLRVGMSDNEVLAHYRQSYPYISVRAAKEVYRVWLKFRHLGALVEKRQRQAREAEQRRLDDLCEQQRLKDARA